MLAATFTLTNCAKEIDSITPENEGVAFEIVASAPQVKTVNDGMKTTWKANDAINLFHAVTNGTSYVNDNSFKITADNLAAGKFTGTLTGSLDPQEEYDWYAFYPYSSYIKTPANTSSGYMPVGSKSNEKQKQTGNSNMAHIAGDNYPVAGRATAVPANSTPEIEMSHVSSLLEVKVTNKNEEALTVSSVSFAAPAGVDIVGTYYINFADEVPTFTGSGSNYVSNIAQLEVAGGTALAKEEYATFYLAIKPFTAAANSTLTLSVNGCTKTINVTDPVEFKAGKIKTLNFGYDKVVAPVGASTDVLNRELTGIEDKSSAYADWSNKKSNTSAVYAGQSAGSNNSIQLRSNNSNSGVITTASAGYVQSVEVTWNSNTAVGRVLNIYGRSTAYTSPTELYNNSTAGTLLGTITCGTSTLLNVDGNYEFIGMRSADGAMYVEEIRITWTAEKQEVSPLKEISVSGYTTEYAVGSAFAFDGVITAKYEDGTSKTVAPTSVSSPSMSTTGNQTVTVTYTEGGITKTFDYTITLTASTESWVQVKSLSEIVTGEYVIVAKTSSNTGYLPSTTTSSSPTYKTTGITINGDQLAAVTDDMKFTFTVSSTSSVKITNSAGKYLYLTNSNSGVRVGGTSITWKIENHDKSGTFKFSAVATSTRYLGVYNNQDWRCYTTYNASNFTAAAGSSAIYLYKKN